MEKNPPQGPPQKKPPTPMGEYIDRNTCSTAPPKPAAEHVSFKIDCDTAEATKKIRAFRDEAQSTMEWAKRELPLHTVPKLDREEATVTIEALATALKVCQNDKHYFAERTRDLERDLTTTRGERTVAEKRLDATRQELVAVINQREINGNALHLAAKDIAELQDQVSKLTATLAVAGDKLRTLKRAARPKRKR